MPPVGFEPTISAGEWTKTYVLDRAATAGTGTLPWVEFINQTSQLIIMQLASRRNMFVAIVEWSLIASRMEARDMVT
jgi:hypothetical protein